MKALVDTPEHAEERRPSSGADAAPQRICSLLPSATEIIAELGLADRLVGVSAECRWPEHVIGKPVVSSAKVETATLTNAQIDDLVRDSTKDGGSLYAVDAELIDRLRPDLIVTQDLCAVCAVSSGDLATACPVEAEILSLDPRTLEDVAGTVLTLARRLGVEDRGKAIAAEMREKIAAVERAVAGRSARECSSPSGSTRPTAAATGSRR